MTTFTTPKTLSVNEAAERTGLSPKALRSRIDRGTLRSVKDRDGKRRILTLDLQRCGLLDLEATPGNASEQPIPRRANPAGVDVAALIDRLIAAELRALEAKQLAEVAGVNAEHDRQRIAELEQQVFQLSVELTTARTHRRRWFSRKEKV